MRFQTDSDRRAWRTYAAAALGPTLRNAMVHDVPDDSKSLPRATELAAIVADLMLKEERNRRS